MKGVAMAMGRGSFAYASGFCGADRSRVSIPKYRRLAIVLALLLGCTFGTRLSAAQSTDPRQRSQAFNFETLRLAIEGWPFDGAAKREASGEKEVRYLGLGDGLKLPMVKIPAGRFVMGDLHGEADAKHPMLPR